MAVAVPSVSKGSDRDSADAILLLGRPSIPLVRSVVVLSLEEDERLVETSEIHCCCVVCSGNQLTPTTENREYSRLILHAAGIADAENELVLREDVGRHSTIDK